MVENSLLNALVIFEKNGTLLKAAEILRISQPALSRSMKKLEEEVGVPLFIRGKNSIRLNENGKLLAREAEKLLKEQEAILEKLRQFDESNRRLRIGISAPGPRIFYEQKIRNLYPQAEMEWVMTSDEDALLSDLEEKKYDFLFLQKRKTDSSLYCKDCLKEKLSICVLPAHPAAAYPSGIHFHDVNGQTFLQNAVVGIWDDVVRKNLPDSKIVRQTSRDDLVTLINNSPLPSFVTNLTDFNVVKYENRVNIPILDREAKITFMAVFRKKDTGRFRNVIEILKCEKEKKQYGKTA